MVRKISSVIHDLSAHYNSSIAWSKRNNVGHSTSNYATPNRYCSSNHIAYVEQPADIRLDEMQGPVILELPIRPEQLVDSVLRYRRTKTLIQFLVKEKNEPAHPTS